MLFKQIHLKGIKDGTVTLAFRKWKRPTVRKGSLLKTSIGQVEIIDIIKTNISQIAKADAFKAGFDHDELVKQLNSVREGDVYRISVRYHSEDPRIKLRDKTKFTLDEFQKIKDKLARLDVRSQQGNWTIKTLELISDHPYVRAVTLAQKSGWEKDWLKINIRKLKNLGLTISHEIGYSLSPLGVAFLERLKK